MQTGFWLHPKPLEVPLAPLVDRLLKGCADCSSTPNAVSSERVIVGGINVLYPGKVAHGLLEHVGLDLAVLQRSPSTCVATSLLTRRPEASMGGGMLVVVRVVVGLRLQGQLLQALLMRLVHGME
jgi:hypothetical protein